MGQSNRQKPRLSNRSNGSDWINRLLHDAKPADPRLTSSLGGAVRYTDRHRSEMMEEVDSELGSPGLRPYWSPGTSRSVEAEKLEVRNAVGRVIAVTGADLSALVDNEELLGSAAAEWDPRLLELWRAGAIYLADDDSEFSPQASILDASVLLRRSHVENGCTTREGFILLRDVSMRAGATVHGDSRLFETYLAENTTFKKSVSMGAYVNWGTLIDEARIGAGAGIGPQVCILGVSHPNLYLQDGAISWGVEVGANCWIGAQALLTAGTRVGEGAIVAGKAKVSGTIAPYRMYQRAGAPTLPVDMGLRSMPWDELYDLGREGGALFAGEFHACGPRRLGMRLPNTVELHYSDHQYLQGVLSPKTLRYQQGALVGFLERYYEVVTSRAWVGNGVRFEVELGGLRSPMTGELGVEGSLTATLQTALANPGDCAQLPELVGAIALDQLPQEANTEPEEASSQPKGAEIAPTVLSLIEDATGQPPPQGVTSTLR